MKNISIIATVPKSSGGGGTDEDPRFPSLELRSHGLVVLIFGFAFGLTSFIAYYIMTVTGVPVAELLNFFKPKPVTEIPTFWDGLGNAALFFVSGFIFGTVLAALYNVLIFRRLNLFGIDRTLN